MAEVTTARRAVVLSLSMAVVEEVSSRCHQKSSFICRLWCLGRKFERCILNWFFLIKMSYLFLKKILKKVFLLLSRTNVGLMALQSLQPRFLKKIKKKKFSFCCHAQMLFSWHFKAFNPVFLPFKKKKKKLIMSYFLIALNPYVMPLSLHYIFFPSIFWPFRSFNLWNFATNLIF